MYLQQHPPKGGNAEDCSSIRFMIVAVTRSLCRQSASIEIGARVTCDRCRAIKKYAHNLRITSTLWHSTLCNMDNQEMCNATYGKHINRPQIMCTYTLSYVVGWDADACTSQT